MWGCMLKQRGVLYTQDYEINFNSAVCLRTSHTILIFKMDGWPTFAACTRCVFQQNYIEVWLCLLSPSHPPTRRRPTNVFPLLHYGNCVLQEIIIMRKANQVDFLRT